MSNTKPEQEKKYKRLAILSALKNGDELNDVWRRARVAGFTPAEICEMEMLAKRKIYL